MHLHSVRSCVPFVYPAVYMCVARATVLSVQIMAEGLLWAVKNGDEGEIKKHFTKVRLSSPVPSPAPPLQRLEVTHSHAV